MGKEKEKSKKRHRTESDIGSPDRKLEKEKKKKRKGDGAKKRVSSKRDVHESESQVLSTKAQEAESASKQTPVKRKIALLPSVVGFSMPEKSYVQSISPAAQNSFFKSIGDKCERIIRMIDDAESSWQFWRNGNKGCRDLDESAAALEDTLLADMAKLRGIPLARQFVEMSLWKRIQKFNADFLDCAEKELETVESRGMRTNSSDEPLGDGSLNPPQTRTDFLSFKKAHMKHLTTEFASDLNSIRKKDKLDISGVKMLLRCLEEGAELFAETSINRM